MWLIYRSTGINKQGYGFSNLANNKCYGLLLWLEPHHQPLPPLKKTLLLSNLKKHVILTFEYSSGSFVYFFNSSKYLSIIFHITEQPMQLSCAVRWRFTLAGIFRKHVLVCTHLLRYKNKHTSTFFKAHVSSKIKIYLALDKKENERWLSRTAFPK